MNGVSVIITAGGSGSRMGTSVPKQFLTLGGKPVLARTIEAFDKHPLIDEIILTIPRDAVELTWSAVINPYRFQKIKNVICGGADRQDSVYNGLQSVTLNTVLIHDGVRPFVSAQTITDVIYYVRQGYAAITGIKTKDTVKITDSDGLVAATPDREKVWLVQTPQGFAYKTIIAAHEQAVRDGFKGTDDGMLVERLGCPPVKMVMGDYRNIKITTPEDLAHGESILTMLEADEPAT